MAKTLKAIDTLTPKTVTPEILEALGQLVDKAENYLAYKDNPFAPDKMVRDSSLHGLEELRDEIKALYLKLGGEDVWPSLE